MLIEDAPDSPTPLLAAAIAFMAAIMALIAWIWRNQ